MKALRKGLALFLAIVLFINILPMNAAAAFVHEVVGEEITLSNDFIKLTVNSKNGRFSIQTLEGQSVRKTDDNSFLSFIGGLFGDGLGDSDTSFTTFRINGTDYIFGNKYNIADKGVASEMGETRVLTSSEYPSIPEGCQAVVTQWSVEGVTITQILLLFPEDNKQNGGNVQIFYQVENKSDAEVNVGARILLDTMVGNNDGPEFQIGTISSNTLRVERMLSRDPVNDQGVALDNKNYWTMPGYWVMRDTLDPSNPLATNVIAYGYTDIATYRPLDYMIVSHWNKLANEKFEEFEDYKAIPAEMTEAAAEVTRTQRLAEKAVAIAEQKEAEAAAKEEAAEGAEEGSKAKLDAEKARADAEKIRAAADETVAAAETAKAALAAIGRAQKGSSIIDPNLDFTDDKNDYGSADSAVAFYWSGEGSASKLAAGGTMQLGTVYGLGEIIEPTSVLAISFPNPVTQVEVNPNDQNAYKNFGIFDINVEIENLALYEMEHDRVDISMTLEKGLRFVKRDTAGNILRDEAGTPLTSYGSTQTVTFEKALTPEQAEKGENNPILPGEKFAATFTVMASGKPWPTTRQYMVTATSPQLEQVFEDKYGNDAGDDVKALYNSSRANFIYLPSVGDGTPTYSTSVSPEESFTKDPKYITVNLTNVEAYNPGSSVRGQEARPNFNLYIEEIVTGKRYQVDVTDNVQFIPTDDGLTGDMRISYTNGTLVDSDGVPLETDLGYELPVGEYRVAIDYISTDEDENAMLDMVTEQTFLVTENEEARIRQPGILAVVKETVDFDDSEIMQKINDLVAEVQAAIEELQGIAEKLESTDWSTAIYDEVVDFAKELVSPVTKIYDDFEKLTDFTNIEADMRALSKNFDELADVDFSCLRDFNLGKALKGVNVDVSLSDEFKKQFDIESLLLGPLGLSGITDLVESGAEGGVDGIYNSIKNYGKNALEPITSVYKQIASLGDFSSLSGDQIAKLKSSFAELSDVDFDSLKSFNFDVSVGLNKGALEEQFKKIIDIDSILAGPLGDGGVTGIYDSIKSYGEDIIKPIMNLFDDIEELTDFSNISDKEIAELKAAFTDLGEVDFSSLKNFDFSKVVFDVSGSVDLSDKFKELFDYETILAGPFAGDGSKSASEVFYDRVKAYGLKLASPITGLFDELEDLADFSSIVSDMESISKNFDELADVDFSCLANFDIEGAIKAVTNSANISVDLSEKFKQKFKYEEIIKGPVDANGEFSVDAITPWLDNISAAITAGENIYNLAKDAYQSKNVKECAQRLINLYNELLNVNISVDFSAALTEANKDAAKQTWDNGKKLALAFTAMYAKMQSVYSTFSNKFNKISDIKSQIMGIVDAVKKLASNPGDALLSLGKEAAQAILGEWLTPVNNAVNSAKDLYDIGQKAYNGKLSVKDGGRLMMDFFEKYLDVNVKVNWSLGEGNEAALSDAAKQAKNMAAAFMVIYARMQNIYNSIGNKIDRVTSVYNQVKDIVNTVTKLINTVADGDFSALANNILKMGKDLISSVINSWLGQIQNAINSVKELYSIGQHAYKGDISLRDGAQLLVDFYETYLDVSVTADLKGVKDAASQSRKVADAFMVMYAQMRSIYSNISSKVDAATNIYNQAKSIINTVIKLVSDPMAAVNDLLNAGQDAIFNLLNTYIDKIKDMVDSVKQIYEIGKKAYEGKIDIKEGAELLIGFCEKYLNISITADLDAVGEENKKAASQTLEQGKKVALAFMAMFARMKNIYTTLSSRVGELTGIYNQMMEIVDTVIDLFTNPAKGAYALINMVKERIMTKLEGLGMYKDMFLEIMDVIENFDSFDPSELLSEAMNFAVTTARVKADQALYSTIYGMLVTAATKLDPNSDYEWSPGELKKSLPTYRLMTFEDEAALSEYQENIAEQNNKKKAAQKTDKEKALVGNDGVLVKITGMIHQLGSGENVTDYIVDTSSEPAIINDTVAFKGSDLVITQGKLKISFGDIVTIDAGEYISKAQSIYGSETPLFDTLIVSGTGQLYIEGSGFVFHEGEWSLDFYNGFDKILDPVKVEGEEKKNSSTEESGTLNETAAWAIGALNDMFNPLKALAITDVYFNRHTLFSAPSFSVAGFGLKFDNYLLRSSEVCFGGHIDFKIVKGEIQNVFFNSEGLQSIEADLKYDLGGDLGLLQKDEAAGGDLIIHYYDPDYLASFKERGYEPPEEKYSLTFNAKLKNVGGVGVQLAFKRVADGRILPDVIAFTAAPPPPGIMVYASLYLTEIRGAIRELADTIAGGSSTVPLTIEAGVDIKFGQAPAVFDGKIDMILKMTGIEFNGKLNYKDKPMITQAQIKAQWVTPWFVSASMEMDVLGLNIIIGKARLFIGQNIEKDRIDFEGFVSAALQIPKSIPVVGGIQLGQVSFGLNNDKIWGSASVGVKPIFVSVGITYYWSGGIEFGTCGEGLPEAYTYLLLERPEEEPILVAVGSGMRTEATSWVNENTIHEIEYHAVGDGVSYLDNGQNDIGIGGIEVTHEGRTHSIPVSSVAEDRDALIEIEYYGEEKTAEELQSMLSLSDGNGGSYTVKIGDMNNPQSGDTAFKQELVTEDGVNRHLVYVMVPHRSINGSFTLNSTERVQTKLLSTPIASSLSSVALSGSGTSYTASVSVADAHEGDTVSLYLTKEALDSTPRRVEAKDDEGNTVYLKNDDGTDKLDANGHPIPLMINEDKDPGMLIFEGIPVVNGSVTQAFDLSNIDGVGSIPYAVVGLGDVRELLESGNYYLRAALKSDTAYSAMTSANSIEITDPKAPSPASGVTLTNAGNGYFNMSFTPGGELNNNEVTSYRVDFYDNQGNLYPNYNGLLFDKAELEQSKDESGNYVVRLGGWTATGGEGTEESPYTYSGLEPGKTYVAKVYAASQTQEGNYHYAAPAESSSTLLPVPQYVHFTNISADSGTMSLKTIEGDSGEAITTSAKQLITNQAAPELTLSMNYPAQVEAYNGDALVGTMSDGKLKLTGLVTDGEYAVELRAKNSATGDLSVTVIYINIDRIEPTIFVTAPAGESVSFSSIQITGMTEPGSAITANGQALNVAADGSFAGNISLNNALASDKIRLEATDKAGNTNAAVISVTNSSFAAPVGLNVVRTGTMKPNTSQQVQVYLKYADGKDSSGAQKFRSVAVPYSDNSKLSYDVVQGEAISVDSNKFTAIREGASLVRVSYKVNDTLTLSTMVAVLVDEKAVDPGIIDDTYKESRGRAIISDSGAADIVVNGKSQTVALDDAGRSIVKITDKDDIDTSETLKVTNLARDASAYILEVDSSVAKELSGENGMGVSFAGGSAQLDLPGENLTGDDLSITIANPNYAQQRDSKALAEQLDASVVVPGVSVKLSGVEIEPGDRVLTRLEIPAGVKVSDITALVYIDENGKYTSLPWKLYIAGSTAYVKCYLPGSGTIVPMSCGVRFSDVKADYWGAEAIAQAAGMMLIRGYENGTFKPNAKVTRAEYATVMLRAAGLMTQPGADINYNDVRESDWYYDVVSIATDLGIMTGYADGSARSNSSITRAESMVIVSRLLKLERLGEEMSEEDVEAILAGFLDNDKIPAWARKDIALCVKSGIIVGSDGEIKAQESLTRVQAAIIASRLSSAIAATM
jgi:hypothetical protein